MQTGYCCVHHMMVHYTLPTPQLRGVAHNQIKPTPTLATCAMRRYHNSLYTLHAHCRIGGS